MASLNILSGGAAQGLVAGLAPRFKHLTGFDIAGEFGAVGAMAEKLRNGTPADMVILTAPIVTKISDENWVDPATIADVGMVETAIAVRAGDAAVSVADGPGLRAALLAADTIFVPDTTTSTAGIHVAKVLQQLGIADDVAARLQIYPNGATAMRHLAESGALRPIGCTQATEIISTPGVKLSGSLPSGYGLATTYTSAVTTRAASPKQARVLIGLLTAADQRELRVRAGFL